MKDRQKNKQRLAKRRQIRTRSKISNTDRPRLTVHRSLKHIYAQIIDYSKRATLVSAKDSEIKDKLSGMPMAEAVGKLIAEKAKAKKIETVVFDKGKYRYHGQIKALADGARHGGLEF